MSELTRLNRAWPITSLTAAGCLWGTGFLFGTITFAEMAVSENVGCIFGALMLLAWIESTHPMRFQFSLHIWLAVIAQGLLCTTAAFLFWNWGLARVPAAHAAIFLNLEPLVGTLLGVMILGEHLGALAILGGAMILFSAAYFSRPKPV